MEISTQDFMIIVPVLVLHLSLMVAGLLDWRKQPKDMKNRSLWLLGIIFVQTIGPLAYFIISDRVSNDEAWLKEEDM